MHIPLCSLLYIYSNYAHYRMQNNNFIGSGIATKACALPSTYRPLCQLGNGSLVHGEVLKVTCSRELSGKYAPAIYIYAYYNTGIRNSRP